MQEKKGLVDMNSKAIRELSVVELEQIAGGNGAPPPGCTIVPGSAAGHHTTICGGTIYVDGHPAGPFGK
jgi:hypothetical protein